MTGILSLAMGPTRRDADDARVAVHDVYDLPEIDLGAYRGIVVVGGADQRFLGTQRTRLSAWVRAGGRMLTNGHPLVGFVQGLPQIRRLEFHGLWDVWLSEVGQHPIWTGVDRRDLLLRTGVPGEHPFDELVDIGVAGFYAHAYLAALPKDATVVTGIGPGKLPVDISYRLGDGEVVVHAGNDLSSFADPGTSAAGLDERILDYLEGR